MNERQTPMTAPCPHAPLLDDDGQEIQIRLLAYSFRLDGHESRMAARACRLCWTIYPVVFRKEGEKWVKVEGA